MHPLRRKFVRYVTRAPREKRPRRVFVESTIEDRGIISGD